MAGRYSRWTQAEDEAVREHYPLHGPAWGGWAEALPGRNQRSIGQRAYALGVHLDPEVRSLRCRERAREMWGDQAWKPEEDELLREHYASRGGVWPEWGRLLPGRSLNSISNRAAKLGIRRQGGRGPARREFTELESKGILRATARIARQIGATPLEVADELTRLAALYREGKA